MRMSNCTTEHMIADVGSSIAGDAGTMGAYRSMLLDRKQYKYNCYHFAISSLGVDAKQFISRAMCTQNNFTGSTVIRTQPIVTNLLAADDTHADLEYSTLLPAMPILNWDFGH